MLVEDNTLTFNPAEVDTDEVAKVQKDLEFAKVKLAKQGTGKE